MAYRDNPKSTADETAADELVLYILNTGELYPMYKSIIANLRRKINRGTYDPRLAPQAWSYLAEEGAKRYAKEFASPRDWNQIFTKATRDLAAIGIMEQAEEDLRQGFADNPRSADDTYAVYIDLITNGLDEADRLLRSRNVYDVYTAASALFQAGEDLGKASERLEGGRYANFYNAVYPRIEQTFQAFLNRVRRGS